MHVCPLLRRSVLIGFHYNFTHKYERRIRVIHNSGKTPAMTRKERLCKCLVSHKNSQYPSFILPNPAYNCLLRSLKEVK